ncbi:MAG TPA: methyltransferase domain-containing protein, partial [Actinomycetota bacterium]|nr:methyltransferase domain-containing protein [Actinomycetota bacterium]
GGTVDPYGYLLDAARRLGNAEQDGLAVEVGTSVGRGAAALAELYAYSLGVDRSFPAVLAARRLLLESPEPLHAYRLETERGRWEQRRSQPPPGGERLDYLAGSGAELPLTGGQAACVAALNVLCAVADPASLVTEFSRVLEPGGLLLVASPYWSDAGDGDGQWAGPESLRRLLAGDFDVVAEEDMVPWLLRLARRRWNVYLSHCVVATRR